MATKYLDSNGLLYFWQKIKGVFVSDVTWDSTNHKIKKTQNGASSDVVTLSTVATSGSYNDLSNKPTIPEGVEKSSTTPKMAGTASVGSETKYAAGDHIHPHDTTKVDTTRKVNGHVLSADVTVTASDIGVEDGAEVNQNAFSNVKVGTTTVAADSKTDTFELFAGDNVTITPDATNDKITISATDTTYTPASATPSMDGTAAVGSSAKYAREDHVHPADTNKVDTTRKVNGHALSSDISLTAADVSAIPTSAKGSASGVCPLDANSKVDASYLPSYVDDVIEAYPVSGASELSAGWLSKTSGGSALTPETGKIYVLMADTTSYAANSQFRWGGTAYVKLADGGVSSVTNSEIDTIIAS